MYLKYYLRWLALIEKHILDKPSKWRYPVMSAEEAKKEQERLEKKI